MHPIAETGYAIIQTGGKQYRVKAGDVIDVELLGPEKQIQFDQILFVHDGKKPHIGQPHVSDCVVRAELIQEIKGPKVIAFKYKKCKNSRRTVGHRQKYSRVKITEIAVA